MFCLDPWPSGGSDSESEDSLTDDVLCEVARFKRQEAQDPVSMAVLKQDLDSLIKFCGGNVWYKYIQPETGNSLLHISVMYGSEDIFKQLLSIKDFPYDHKNQQNQTALYFCLDRSNSKYDKFAYDLIKKGASVECAPLEEKETLLHCTIEKGLVKTSILLMERGYDVNARCSQSLTPLWLCFVRNLSKSNENEIVTALLAYGADPNLIPYRHDYNSFEYAVQYSSEIVQEALFYYMIDEYTVMDVHLETLLLLAKNKSPFFQDIVKCTRKVIVAKSSLPFGFLLFSIDINDLDALVKKCPDAIRKVFTQKVPFQYKRNKFSEKVFLENINFLLESDLQQDAISFVGTLCRRHYLYFLVSQGAEENVLLEHVCFFMSYGLKLDEYSVRGLYTRYGYGELLRIILHMDITITRSKDFTRHPLLILLRNTKCSLQLILEKFDRFIPQDVGDLVHYFSDAQLRTLCCDDERPEIIDVIENQPQVPLLVELARNAFRNSCAKMYSLANTKQFYTLVNQLSIASVHKKIITLEQKLYS